MVILAAKLAHEVLELIDMDAPDLCRLQFRVVVQDLKNLDEHLQTIS
jgi:hypothetical protein